MQKIFLLSLLFILLLFITAQAQNRNDYGEFIAEELTKMTNGYIDPIDVGEPYHALRINLPENTSFYDLRTQVSSFVNEYSSIDIHSVWRRHDGIDEVNEYDIDIDVFIMYLVAGENEYGYQLHYARSSNRSSLTVGWGFKKK